MGFLLGLLVGIVLGPLILAIIAKPLSKWFLKRKAKGFIKDLSSDVRAKMDKFQGVVPELNNGKENQEKARK